MELHLAWYDNGSEWSDEWKRVLVGVYTDKAQAIQDAKDYLAEHRDDRWFSKAFWKVQTVKANERLDEEARQ